MFTLWKRCWRDWVHVASETAMISQSFRFSKHSRLNPLQPEQQRSLTSSSNLFLKLLLFRCLPSPTYPLLFTLFYLPPPIYPLLSSPSPPPDPSPFAHLLSTSDVSTQKPWTDATVYNYLFLQTEVGSLELVMEGGKGKKGKGKK